MSLTGNYEAAFELSEQTVKDIFQAAYENNEIPHEVTASSTVAGFPVSVVANILQTSAAGELELVFDTPVYNGLEMRLPLDVEAMVENPPAPSINPMAFGCYLKVTAPVEGIPSAVDGNQELVLNMHGLPSGQVQVDMPADPVVEVNEALVEDGLHKAYDDNIIPHQHNFAGFQVDVLDDDTDPARQIQFTLVQPVTYTQEGNGTISLPLYIHFLGGIETTATIQNVKLELVGDECWIKFGDVTASDVSFSLPLSVPGAAGAVAGLVNTFGTYKVFVPRNSTIGEIIAAEVRSQLNGWGADGNGRVHLYTPNAVENTPIEIRTFTPVVKPGFLAVLFNPMANADADSVENFIPADKKFAQALAEPVVQEMFDEAIRVNILEENGDTDFPCTFDEKIEGHKVTLTNEPSFVLHTGYIKMEGSAEVAVDCWFDPDVDYEAKVNFYFDVDENGDKIVKPNVYDEDMDLSCLDWFLGLIFIIYGWIALGIVNSVIEEVGGEIISNEGDDIADGTKYLAGEIHGVGSVTTELDQIDIEPRGIILSGGTFIVSASQPLTYVPSDDASPYKCSAGQSLNFKAKYTASGAKHVWDIGDDIHKQAYEFSEPFTRSGIYPLKLVTEMSGPRSADTRHFGRVRVDSVKPAVNIGPDITVDEGESVEFTGMFTNPEYEDVHKARWGWGDDSMDIASLTETHHAPMAQGTVHGEHAYGNNGDYEVTLRVIDDDGCVGMDTKTVKVLNVPPTVYLPDFFYAYPDVPVTLIADFTDPGWLDTHRARWSFGDDSELLPATIKEVNDPPIGYGLAAATHTYRTLGTFLARCEVLDSDHAAGAATMPVHVIELKNRRFEEGFRNLECGAVANHWQPYGQEAMSGGAAMADVAGATGAYSAEQNVVHDGQRSQRVVCRRGGCTGLFQQVGTNEGWDYQLTVWYHIDQATDGHCRLGVDPMGNTDAKAADVQWFEGHKLNQWDRMMVRVSAASRRLTVFLETVADTGSINAYFDGAELIPYPAPLPDPEPPEPEEPDDEHRRQCVDWKNIGESQNLAPHFMRHGFAFQSLQNANMRVVVWGGAGEGGQLVILRSGIKIVLPFTANRIKAWITHYKIEVVTIRAWDATGREVGQAVSRHREGGTHEIVMEAGAITEVTMISEGGEAMLDRICAFTETKKTSKTNPEEINHGGRRKQ